jgi:formylglycine-generating enzyme required for sulfatase activity
MAQGGNVWEWTERDLTYDPPSPYRVLRGGGWYNFGLEYLTPEPYIFEEPNYTDISSGFRVASIPEPNSLWLATMAVVFVGWRRRTYHS